MIFLDWECFDSSIKDDLFSIVDVGPLYGPIISFTIERNKNLQLKLKTISESNSKTNRITPKANSVTAIDGEVKFQSSHNDSIAIAWGITPYNNLIKFSQTPSPSSSREETSLVKSIKWKREEAKKTAYTIDWIENLSNRFLWPHSDETKNNFKEERRFIAGNDQLVIESSTQSEGLSRSCAQIQVGSYKVIIGKSPVKKTNVNNPGFILYIGDPDEEIRKKIRDCLSYLLGDFFIYLGWTSFDAEWKRTCFCAVSAHALYDKAQGISGRPPAPLGYQYELQISPDLLSQMASSLFDIYDSYKLQNVFWNYWHAKAAPVHMAAVHFGAAIESLQRTYFKNTKKGAQLLLIKDKELWDKIYQNIIEVIDSHNIPAAEKLIITNKAKTLNNAPQSSISEKFFENLNLEISDLEKKAWSNRNKAAHGASIKEGDEIKSIRENKILMILINRIVLSLNNSGKEYYDYYSIDRPIRKITEGLSE